MIFAQHNFCMLPSEKGTAAFSKDALFQPYDCFLVDFNRYLSVPEENVREVEPWAEIVAHEIAVISLATHFRNMVEEDRAELFSFFPAALIAQIREKNIPLLIISFTESYPEFLFSDDKYCLAAYLHDFVEQNGLQNVSIALPDFFFAENYQAWCSRTGRKQCFLPQIINYFEKNTYFYAPESYKSGPLPAPVPYEKRFIMLCARPHSFRLHVFHFLVENGLLDNFFYFSFLDRNKGLELEEFQRICIDENPWEKSKYNHTKFFSFLEQAPYTLDVHDPSHEYEKIISATPEEFLRKSGIYVAMETDFDSATSLFLTEKTFKALLLGKPFLLVGQPGSLATLRALGYQTFPHIFDESYDFILENDQRLRFLLKEMKRVCLMNETRFSDLVYSDQTKSIVEHNRRLFLSRAQGEYTNPRSAYQGFHDHIRRLAEREKAQCVAEIYAKSQRLDSSIGHTIDYRSMYFEPNLQRGEVTGRFYLDSGNLHTDFATSYILRWATNSFSKFMKSEQRPWILLNGDTNLINRAHFSSEEIDHMRKHSLAIFFYEPLFLCDELGNWVPVQTDDANFHVPELEWVYEFYKRYGSNIKITIYTCDYDPLQRLTKKYPDFDFRTFDTFLIYICDTLLTNCVTKHRVTEEFGEISEQALEVYARRLFSQKLKFVTCPNFRYESIRHLVVAYLVGKGYHNDGLVSFFHTYREEEFLKNLSFNPKEWDIWETIANGLEKLDTLVPLEIAVTNAEAVSPDGLKMPSEKHNSNVRKDMDEYRFREMISDHSFLIYVNESRAQYPLTCVTEKILIPIMCLKPWVVLAGPYTLRYIRRLGFQTFGDLWDESYDEEEHHGTRVRKTLELLEWFHNLDEKELARLKERLIPIVIHNYLHLTKNLRKEIEKTIIFDRARLLGRKSESINLGRVGTTQISYSG